MMVRAWLPTLRVLMLLLYGRKAASCTSLCRVCVSFTSSVRRLSCRLALTWPLLSATCRGYGRAQGGRQCSEHLNQVRGEAAD